MRTRALALNQPATVGGTGPECFVERVTRAESIARAESVFRPERYCYAARYWDP
jgi:hypothetical protein